MSTVAHLDELFDCIDRKDVSGFAAHLTDDVIFQFGNSPSITGKQNAAGAVAAFFRSIMAIKHHLSESWQTEDVVVCHGIVSYTKLNGKSVAVPFANIMRMRNGLAYEYRIFVDASPLASEA